MTPRSRLGGMAVVALFTVMLGCSVTSLNKDQPKGCEVDGKHYEVGEHFPAPDGCNTCTCMKSGDVGCTQMGCVATCTYGGKTYQQGETFPALDGCNTCSCTETGDVGCTELDCVVSCTYGGKTYQQGEYFPALDGCNKCWCVSQDVVGCTMLACAQGCTYAGEHYEPGSSFPALDGCNTCTCGDDDMISCTELACACDPDKEWFRSYIATDPKACEVIDYACPPNTVSFSNPCGCGCEQDASCPEWFDCMPPSACDPQKIQLECPYSGIAY